MDKQTDLLQQVKDEYAKEHYPNYPDWDHFISDTPFHQREFHYDQVAEAYHAAKLQEGKTNLLRLMYLADHILSMDKHMANQFQGSDYRQMWEIWRGVADKAIEIEQQLKSKR
ncbi:hypothetical protein [Niabella aurantiaca]|uniref:hypothetical protein n=1 Tax=Niabella aurantiaca TaxID=379900 RepID=UPI00036A74C9|nr:hypothetical protein [Niabella aurantiaca]